MIDIEKELTELLREIDKMGRSVLDLIEIEYLKKDFLNTIEEYLIEQFANSDVAEEVREEGYNVGYDDGHMYGHEEGYAEGHAAATEELREDGII